MAVEVGAEAAVQRPDWSRIWAFFDEAVALAPAQREDWLLSQCVDPELQQPLRALLRAHDAAAQDPCLEPEQRLAPPLLPVGARVGVWRVVRLIGRGGMGQVFEVARADGNFRQRAALKLLARTDAETDVWRFAQEREILAHLEHPGIARLLDGGVHQQRLYAVLEFVEGSGFTEHARALSVQDRVRLLLQVCEAVAAAHRCFIVHRDLKPANVLVTAEGQIKLLDFGIAKRTGPGVPLSDATQAIPMSPDYCAPEQLQGAAITVATDIYSLGVMLYELLAEQRPWAHGGPAMSRALARLGALDITPPSRCAPQARRAALRGDLDAIVLKALQPEPHERYPTVEALIDDLRRYLDARPVAARSQVATYVLARALRRHRWWVGAAAAIVLSLSVGLAGTGWHARQARIERDVARQEADRADAVRQYLIYMFRNAAEMEAPATLKAKAVLDDAAQRLHDHFSGDPARAATMMQALGELYFLISDYEGGIPLLQQLLTVAERGAGLPDDALARTRYTLGQMYERVGRNADAAAMLAQAQAFWATDARHHRRDLVRSRVLEAQLHRERGDLLAALAVLERAQEESVAVFDRDDRESGVLQDSLGRLYFSLGRPDDADAALTEAWRIWEARRSTLSADALSTLNGQAALAAQRGDYGAAEDLYRWALDQRRALFGPSRALSTLLGNYGRLRLLQHDAAAAKPLLQEALLLARRYTGERSPQVLVAMVGLADAHTQLGETAEAAALLEQARADSVVATGAAYPLALMVEMSWVRLHMAERRYPDARHLLDTAASRLEALGVSGVRYLPQVEQLRAELAAL